MKFAAVVLLVLAFPAAAATADEDVQARLDAKAEACISASAPQVARAEPSMAAAVDFLVSDLCARPIEVAGKYRLNRKVLDVLIRQQKTAMTPAAAVAPPPAKPADGASAPADDKAQKAAAAKQAKLAGLEAARVTPETGELEGLPAPYSMITDLANVVLGLRAPQASAEIKAFAAHAVLSAREAKP